MAEELDELESSEEVEEESAPKPKRVLKSKPKPEEPPAISLESLDERLSSLNEKLENLVLVEEDEEEMTRPIKPKAPAERKPKARKVEEPDAPQQDEKPPPTYRGWAAKWLFGDKVKSQ